MFGSRRRIRELELELAVIKGSNKLVDGVIQVLMNQNKSLLDRLMARDLPELKTYDNDGIISTRTRELPAGADELNAGEVLTNAGIDE
jgi:hypothetical protein